MHANLIERVRVVPFTMREWNIVKDSFLSQDGQELRKAVALLAMWKCRMGNKAPIIIEISELVLRVIIMDKERDPSDWFTNGNLKLVYGSVIIRWVLFVEKWYY
uniref:Uncharacterized protein n=1 Tax=Acrobeloides nanus TaxID=290746 RepID=A0A914CYG7_9BILA